MHTNAISLIIINKEEKNTWSEEFTYDSHSPRYGHSISFIKASQVAEKSNKLDTGKQIQVSSTATVSEVIATARACYPGYDKDFKVVERRPDGEYGYPLKYYLYYPALSDRRLEDSAKISDLGIVDGDLVLISQERPPRRSVLMMTGVSSFKNFQQMVWGNETPYDPMLLATLLYTDSDIDLARYVREHFDEIHQMSGPRVITYVVERPPKDRSLAAPLFWKAQLDIAVHHVWALLGWTQSKPYDKTAAYEIAHSLGIYPNQLPCLAVFDRTDQAEKIIFPVSGDYTAFFRSTFSNIQRALNLGPGPDIWDEEKLNRERLKLFEKIRESLSLIQVDAKGQSTTYHFHDRTVLINHPTGPLQLQDFQNTKQD
jgi:hypothetical protein